MSLMGGILAFAGYGSEWPVALELSDFLLATFR